MLIDFHTHLFPDALAPRALASLAETSGVAPVTDGTAAGTLAAMDGWGVDRFVVQHIATSPRQMTKVNDFAISIDGSHGGRVRCFGSVHFESPDALAELARIRGAGLRGVKLHPDYQGFDADDRRVYPIYEETARLGLTLTFHAGFDPLSPDHVHCTPAMVAKVLRDFPRLRVVCAHFGGFRMWDAVEAELVGKDVYLDTSFCSHGLDPRQAARIVARHGARRILFGSDCPWERPVDSLRFLQSLGLHEAEAERIACGNALELLGE